MLHQLFYRYLGLLLITGFFLCSSATNANSQTSILVGLSDKEQATYKKINAALDKVGELKLKGTPLSKLPAILSEKLGVSVIIDERAFEDSSISVEDEIITKNSPKVSYRAGLKVILRGCSAVFTIRHESLLSPPSSPLIMRDILKQESIQ